MAAILWRLQARGLPIGETCEKGTNNWIFQRNIAQYDIRFFRYLVKHHQLLNLEYSVHSALLAKDLLQKDLASMIRQIEAALLMAELLEHLYSYYLIVPREAARFRREQDIYRMLLAKEGYQFLDHDPHLTPDSPTSKLIRELTFPANLTRNFAARVRRVLVAIAPIVRDFERYSLFIASVDAFTSPIFAYAGWIFFVPRAVVNLYFTGKHVIPGSWMGPQEKLLGWQTRFRAQMAQRWFELGIDIVALAINLNVCFVLVGSLAPISLYAGAGLLFYELVLAGLRAYIEISRLKKIEEQYKHLGHLGERHPEERAHIESYLVHLRQRIAHEQKRLGLHVLAMTIICTAFFLTFPLFAFNPIIPLIGASITLLSTGLWWGAIKWVDRQKPADKIVLPESKIPSVSSVGFFKMTREDRQNNPAPEIVAASLLQAPS